MSTVEEAKPPRNESRGGRVIREAESSCLKRFRPCTQLPPSRSQAIPGSSVRVRDRCDQNRLPRCGRATAIGHYPQAACCVIAGDQFSSPASALVRTMDQSNSHSGETEFYFQVNTLGYRASHEKRNKGHRSKLSSIWNGRSETWTGVRRIAGLNSSG